MRGRLGTGGAKEWAEEEGGGKRGKGGQGGTHENSELVSDWLWNGNG